MMGWLLIVIVTLVVVAPLVFYISDEDSALSMYDKESRPLIFSIFKCILIFYVACIIMTLSAPSNETIKKFNILQEEIKK